MSKMGFGMPFNSNTTDKYNLSNISSLEIPDLPYTFAYWLRSQDLSDLEALNVTHFPISESLYVITFISNSIL